MASDVLAQASADLCSETEVSELVRGFYARVREDALLGPVFAARVDDWEAHLLQLIDFWSAMLRGTRRFNGAPMPKHMAMSELSAALFERWLQLFRATTAELGNVPMQRLADDIAARIADTFWRRFRALHWPTLPMHPAG